MARNAAHTTARRTSAQDVPATRMVSAALGLSCLWSCLGSSATVSMRQATIGSASAVTAEWHAVVMGAFYLLAVVACLAAHGRLSRALVAPGAPKAAAALGIGGCAGYLLLAASPLAGGSVALATAATLAGFALVVAFSVGHILTWGTGLSRMPLPRAVVAVAASNALACGLQLAFAALSPQALLAYLVVCPLGSAVCCLVDVARARREPADGNRTPAGAPSPHRTLGELARGLPWKLVAPIVVLIYLEQALSSLLFERYESWPSDNLPVTFAIGCAIWLAATLYLARSAAGPAASGTESPARWADGALAALFAALLVVYLAALLATVLFAQDSRLLVERFLIAAGSSFRVLLWLVVAVAIRRQATTPVVGYLCYVFFVLAIPVSRLATIALDQAGSDRIATLTSPVVIVPVAGVVLFLVAAAFIIGSVRQPRAALQADTPAGGTDAHDATCRAVAEEAGLSAREAEVLELVCHGYTAKRAGERLGISESTVVSHMKHIYRKLGVPSKQELIALVEARRAQG